MSSMTDDQGPTENPGRSTFGLILRVGGALLALAFVVAVLQGKCAERAERREWVQDRLDSFTERGDRALPRGAGDDRPGK